MERRLDAVESILEKGIFSSRWLLAPLFIGLIICIMLLLVKFFQELIHMVPHIFSTPENELIIEILTLVDMALVGSLLLMIIFSGYEIFVSKIDIAHSAEDKPDWMGTLDFSGLKLKLIGAIVAISAIDILKSFVKIPADPTEGDIHFLTWKVIIHGTFVLSGVMFALMDRIAESRHAPHNRRKDD